MKSFNDAVVNTDATLTTLEGNLAKNISPNEQIIPLQETATVSIATVASGSATISVATGYKYYIKSFTVTPGADVTVSSILIDGNDTYQIASLSDTVIQYGNVITSDTDIVIGGDNAGTVSEDLTITINGYKIQI